MMERVFKGRMVPLLVLFFAVLLPQFIVNLTSLHNYFVAAMIGMVIILYLVVFSACAKKYHQYVKNVRK